MAEVDDEIDLEVLVRAAVDDAWSLVGEPGWFVNEGQLVDHRVDWSADMGSATVTDPDHGTFTFAVDAWDPPRHAAYRAPVPQQGDDERRVKFWLKPEGDRVRIRVIESGFSAMHVPDEEKAAQYEQNHKTWTQQLRLAKEHLEPN